MKDLELSRQQAAEAIMAQVDMLGLGHLDPSIELHPVDVICGTTELVVVIMTKEAYLQLEDELRERGCTKIVQYTN